MPLKTNLYLSERIVLLRIVDLLFIAIGLYVSNYYLDFKYLDFKTNPFALKSIVLFTFFIITGQVFELYRLRDSASRFRTTKNLFVTTCITVLLYLYTPIITPVLPKNRIEILTLFIVIFISVFTWRFFYIITLSGRRFYKRVLIISGSQTKLDKIVNCIENKANDNKIFGYISPLNVSRDYIRFAVGNITKVIKENNIKELIISLDGFSDEEKKILNQNLVHYFELGIKITSSEDFIERITECVPEENMNKYFYKYFNISDSHENRLYLSFIRCLDIFSALIGLSVLLIAIPFVFVGNILGNRGGLFYKQERVGEKGKNFWIVKFRSMVTTAEKDGAQWAVKNDTRITTFGKFLRKTRLDEIPQFWNVLKGEMSLIGPRPERPQFVNELEEKIPLYAIRHAVKPGLTGWAQVMYPYASTMEEQKDKLRYDLYYIKNRNLFIDFKIIIKTINTVLYFKGQ